MDSNLSFLVQKLLTFNAIVFDKKELNFQINSHPSYPSLHAVTGVLSHFNIENVALRVSVDLETVKQLPDFFLALIEYEKTKQFAVVSKGQNIYQVFISPKNKLKITEEDFVNFFTGIVVGVEKPENELQRPKKHKAYSSILFSVLAFLVLSLIVLSKPSLLSGIYLFISVIGAYVSYIILKQENGQETLIGKAFCSSETNTKSCNDVLTSKGATFFSEIKLSVISAVYFVGILIASFLFLINYKSLDVLYIFAFFSIPAIIYSLYYQAWVLKKWCLLCVSIVFLLLLQIMVGYYYFSSFTFKTILIENVLITLFVFISVFLAISYLVNSINEIQALNSEKIDLHRFKKNYSLFKTLLDNSEGLKTNINAEQEIIFGNNNAKIEIIIVTSPFCGHCRPVHKLISNILNRYKNDVKIVIRFNVINKIVTDKLFTIVNQLVHIYNKYGPERCLLAMHDAYSEEALRHWYDKWDEHVLDDYTDLLNIQTNWCIENDINFTPAIILNGKYFPKEYNRDDLIYFIEDLKDDLLN